MMTMIEAWKQEVIEAVELVKVQEPKIKRMVAEMQDFIRTLPAEVPPPSMAGVTEEDPTGYLLWQDRHDFCMEVSFREGLGPVMFAGFANEVPEYVGYYCDASWEELNKLLKLMEEPESCH